MGMVTKKKTLKNWNNNGGGLTNFFSYYFAFIWELFGEVGLGEKKTPNKK